MQFCSFSYVLYKQRKGMQVEYENLAAKYAALGEHASLCESDNRELVTALKNSANNQGVLEQTLGDSSALVESYEDTVRKLKVQIKNLETQTNDENKDAIDGSVISDNIQKTETNVEKFDTEMDSSNDQLTENPNDGNAVESTLHSKDQQIESLKQNIEKLREEYEQARSHASKVQGEVEQHEKVIEELTNKSNNLQEERDYLLRDKQEKSLQLAELKNLLSHEQYKQKEVVEKAANDSFELNDVNTSLLGEIETLNETLGRMEEERKGELQLFHFLLSWVLLSRLSKIYFYCKLVYIFIDFLIHL